MTYQTSRADRIRAALPMIGLHAALGLALLRGLAVPAPEALSDDLKLIDLTAQPPPAEEPPPPPPPSPGPSRAERRADPRAEGAASPPNITSRPTEVVALPPIVPLIVPPLLTSAPIAGPGHDPSAGAADVPGPGTGSGGIGDGTGSGRSGGGAGGGGGGGDGDRGGMTPPRWLRGSLANSDYPAGLGELGVTGTVSVRYAVETDGRVTDCTITSSSGSDQLDQTTCRLIERRFRFAPSRDRAGRPIRSFIVENHHWEVIDLPPDPPPQRSRRRPW